MIGAIWLAWLLILLWLTYKVLAWQQSYFIVTDKRLILTSGMSRRRPASVPIHKVTSWSLRDSSYALQLGYKSLVFTSDDDKAERTITYIPLTAARSIEAALPSAARKADDEDVYMAWAPARQRLRRRLPLIMRVFIISSLAALAAVIFKFPHSRAIISVLISALTVPYILVDLIKSMI